MRRREALWLIAGGAARAAAGAGLLGVRIGAVSARTVRITVGMPGVAVPENGSLLPRVSAATGRRIGGLTSRRKVAMGDLAVELEPNPPALRVSRAGAFVQRFALDPASGRLRFATADGPVLGLGEGGPQFDRRGWFDEMKNGQSGYRQRTHGARVPVPFVIGTGGWALFVHHPEGRFDFTDKAQAVFIPRDSPDRQPLDFFVTAAREPAALLAEYARLTGLPGLPPLWSFGYQQSHRTLASRDEVMGIARTFRQKKLPCDVLIYLGTGFSPSGWNTGHGSFTFNSSVFPDPSEMIRELHREHFRVVLHTVYRDPVLHGSVADACRTPGDVEEASCYWQMHRKVSELGIDGWWPDEGDQLDAASRLCRDRMYYDGPRSERPDVRPYALHRNGYAGSQRYGAFLWSGDVSSTWETLGTHVPVAINTSLSGLPYWGTDTGGFVPTKELTGELYVRWFQFSAFCPLFRSHGRTWKLRLPWQWNTGEMGPSELSGAGAADPDPRELHNPAVEPICRKYLELRYRLMPYLYTAVRECHETGLPIIRALWLHYPDDPAAVLRADEYLWGRDMLVAPVVEQGAAARRLYLPRGDWYDFWTESAMAGGREIERAVDLETIPLYVRAGAILPAGPLKQYTADPVEGPVQLNIYAGADGRFVLYEDDGVSYGFMRGDYSKIRFDWNDRARVLTVAAEHSPTPRPYREFVVRVAPGMKTQRVIFRGNTVRMRLA